MFNTQRRFGQLRYHQLESIRIQLSNRVVKATNKINIKDIVMFKLERTYIT